MDKVRASLLVFLLSALMVLSLSYILIPQGGLAKGISKFHERHSGENSSSKKLVSGEGNVPPRLNFTFKPTNKTAPCPVSLYPSNPMLVCVDTPAKNVPISINETWDLLVKQPGVYYVPLETYGLIKGVDKLEYLRIDRPLQKTPVGGTFSVRITSTIIGSLIFNKSKYLEVVDSSSLPGEFMYTIHVANDTPPGYYPLFFELNVSGYIENALLAWVQVLPRAVVRITSLPSTLRGNDELTMHVSGTVAYPNGSPIRRGTVAITINRTKAEKGIVVGMGNVVNGTFNVTCSIPSSVSAGGYSVVAHYTGPDAYPGNSDPRVVIQRYPEIDVNVTTGNETMVTGLLHYGNIPLNGTVILVVRTDNGTVRIPVKVNNGVFNVTLSLTVKSVKILYPGNGLYLSVEKTVYKKPFLEFRWIEIHVPNKATIYSSILALTALGIVGILMGRRVRIVAVGEETPEQKAPEPPKVSELPIKRRVFVEREVIELPDLGCKLKLDGRPVEERRAELRRTGLHILEACDMISELWVLHPKEAVVTLYKLHFLPFAMKYVPVENKTPFEIALALSEKGFPGDVFQIARIFTTALYSPKDVNRENFFRMVDSLQRMGVFQ
ncbi:Ig-like domain-containing protein [Thermococcus sp.]|uniref:Ig-like domain-containing protein n=1 Tax=Thermococcus sp. TaxID=35749 RepID=UPI00263698B6|nr:Ig-like domain-containing protein [Thermococcus sp.]